MQGVGNTFADAENFKWRNRSLFEELTSDGINKDIIDHIKKHYIYAIQDYFSIIENKEEEVFYFELAVNKRKGGVEKAKTRGKTMMKPPIRYFSAYLDEMTILLRKMKIQIIKYVQEHKQKQETTPPSLATITPTIKPKKKAYLQINESVFEARLDTLHRKLKRGDFIKVDRHDTFSKIFNPDNKTTIEWIGTKSSLCYFIEKLHTDKILIDTGSKWKNAQNVFVKTEGNFSGLRNTIKGKLYPSSADEYKLNQAIKDSFIKIHKNHQ